MIQKNIKSDDNRLISSQLYDLQGLFVSTDNSKIVIPDLQRDYCWGNAESLVNDFVYNLIKHFKNPQLNSESEPKDLIMGLIYGYYEKNRPYLQLCDGQQRLTTLYLLLGLLNMMSGKKNAFKHFLISDFEYDLDDKEPTLLYAIRDSSLYFLSDLVCKFFIISDDVNSTYDWTKENALAPSTFVKGQPWWFYEYETDPTIDCMLKAMDAINGLIKSYFGDRIDEIEKFGQYITEHLLFVFYNMGSRKDGEETFVIINTTGEPLTSTENLKPLVVTQGSAEPNEWKERSEIWEKIDNYFWRYRPDGDDTSDAGMKEFLRLVLGVYYIDDEAYYQLLAEENYKFPIERINEKNLLVIDCMDELYQVVCRLKDYSKELFSCPLLPINNDYAKKNLNDYFVILPVLRYCVKYPNATALDIKRVYAFFENLKRYKTIAKETNNILLAIQAIDKMPNLDIISLLQVKDTVDKTYILTAEEELRLEIYKRFTTERCEIENVFNEISSHPVLQGRIECLIKHFENVKESETFDFGSFDFDVFQKYVEVFKRLFNAENENQLVSDLTIISTACIEGIMGNPVVDGDKCDFLYRKDQWNKFFCDSKSNWDKLVGYFKSLIGANNVEDAQKKYIETWLQKDSSKVCRYYNFVKYFKENNFKPVVFCNANDFWQNKRLVISNPLHEVDSCFVRVRYRINYNWQDFYLFGTKCINCGGRENWKNLECYVGEDGCCLYIDHATYNIAIDFLYDKQSDKGQLRIFAREGSANKDASDVLNKIFEKYCLKETQCDGRHVTPVMPPDDVITCFDGEDGIRAFIDAEVK